MIERPRDLDDNALLDLVQRQTFRYFWDFAHPTSGLARERSNISFGYGLEVATSGGSGFGVMAVVVAVERGWISRQDGLEFLLKMTRFLTKPACSYPRRFPHFPARASRRRLPL